jgi:hypothetical protein
MIVILPVLAQFDWGRFVRKDVPGEAGENRARDEDKCPAG